MLLEPIVKWSGSKRSQAAEIVARMPREIATYYEPFCGGCSVLYRLLNTPSMKVSRYVASDVNRDLIGLWNMIRDYPEHLCEGYARLWEEFNSDPYKDERLYQWSTSECYDHRKKYFANVRARYNKFPSPIDFLFIMRTVMNGMPRYNKNGKFNSSCHFTRSGINPDRLKQICMEWSRLLKEKKVEFRICSYEELSTSCQDFIYLDPPYINTKGMYYGGIDIDNFFAWLRKQKCKWLMSFDGKAGGQDMTYDVPNDVFSYHEYIHSGHSSFRRIVSKNGHVDVMESLYGNYMPF